MGTEAGSSEWTPFASPQWARCVIDYKTINTREYKDRAILAWRLRGHDPEYLDHMGIIWSTKKDDPERSSFILVRFHAPGDRAVRNEGEPT